MKKLVGIILAVTLLCQGDEFLDDAMERYDFASWAGTTNAIYVSTVPMMDVPTISLPTNGMSTFAKITSDPEYQEKRLLIFFSIQQNPVDGNQNEFCDECVIRADRAYAVFC